MPPETSFWIGIIQTNTINHTMSYFGIFHLHHAVILAGHNKTLNLGMAVNGRMNALTDMLWSIVQFCLVVVV